MTPPRVWTVFGAWLLAFVTIVLFSLLAFSVVRALYPELPERDVLDGLTGLLAGGIAASAALLVTLATVCRPIDPAALRLRPGRETGRELAVMIAGTLALGQALDSLTVLAGLANRGSMAVIRHALEGAAGSDLFAAVVVVGVLAGTAEEVFFRGYMQSRLVTRWPPAVAVLVTSVAFGLFHLDWVHALLAFALGLYLGFVTEVAGSALPAVAAHVINNAVFTLTTATVGSVGDFRPNVALAAGAGLVFVGCLVWLWSRRGRLPAG